MTADEIEALFARADGRYGFARWRRPLAPVVFGVDDAALATVKGAIAAVAAAARHPVVETDPEMGANLMVPRGRGRSSSSNPVRSMSMNWNCWTGARILPAFARCAGRGPMCALSLVIWAAHWAGAAIFRPLRANLWGRFNWMMRFYWTFSKKAWI